MYNHVYFLIIPNNFYKTRQGKFELPFYSDSDSPFEYAHTPASPTNSNSTSLFQSSSPQIEPKIDPA